MDMSTAELLSYIVVGVIGFMLGATAQYGYLKKHGKRIVVPFISNSSKTTTVAALGLALLSLFTIFQVHQSEKEREKDNLVYQACQQSFQEALAYNADVTKAEKPYRDRKDSAEAMADNALNTFVRSVLTPGVDVRVALGELNATQDKAAAEIVSVNQELSELTKSRKAYPEPSCQPTADAE